MINRTELTEALASVDLYGYGGCEDVVIEAARLLLDFPTDQQVEAAAERLFLQRFPRSSWGVGVSRHHIYEGDARAALEAVRDTMIGNDQ